MRFWPQHTPPQRIRKYKEGNNKIERVGLDCQRAADYRKDDKRDVLLTCSKDIRFQL
jgi:hypothetical protein